MKESAYTSSGLGKGRKSCPCTRFSLKKVTNAGGIAYSQAQFAVERALTKRASPDPFDGRAGEAVRQRVRYEDETVSAMAVDPNRRVHGRRAGARRSTKAMPGGGPPIVGITKDVFPNVVTNGTDLRAIEEYLQARGVPSTLKPLRCCNIGRQPRCAG